MTRTFTGLEVLTDSEKLPIRPRSHRWLPACHRNVSVQYTPIQATSASGALQQRFSDGLPNQPILAPVPPCQSSPNLAMTGLDQQKCHPFESDARASTLGSKSQPPLPPPMGSVVREFLKICSKPRNLMTDSVTVGWKRRPPAKYHHRLFRHCFAWHGHADLGRACHHIWLLLPPEDCWGRCNYTCRPCESCSMDDTAVQNREHQVNSSPVAQKLAMPLLLEGK